METFLRAAEAKYLKPKKAERLGEVPGLEKVGDAYLGMEMTFVDEIMRLNLWLIGEVIATYAFSLLFFFQDLSGQ